MINEMYPRGIQKLVSTCELPETPGWGGILGQSQLKVPSPGQISRGGVFWGSHNSKCQVLAKFQFGGEGDSEKPKCQVLAKFQFSWAEGGILG